MVVQRALTGYHKVRSEAALGEGADHIELLQHR